MQALHCAAQRVEALGTIVTVLDLRQMNLPFCDGAAILLDQKTLSAVDLGDRVLAQIRLHDSFNIATLKSSHES